MKNELPRNTKIICTLGPKTSTKEAISKLIDSGMTIARLNCSHGTYESLQDIVAAIKEVRKEKNCIFGFGIDTSGPEIRTGELKTGYFDVKKEQSLVFTCGQPEEENDIYLAFEEYEKLKVGQIFTIDDGKLRIKIDRLDGCRIYGTSLDDLKLASQKSVNFPDLEITLPFLSRKTQADIDFGVENGCDFIFLSFVSNKDNVMEVKELIKNAKNLPLVISKIENQEGLDNIDEIIDVSDGIMIARGDLAALIGHSELMMAQKMITKKCLDAGKPFIIATEMMESMVNNSKPTRAEISDVGNSVFDYCDAVMTSSETAVGKHPYETIKMMNEIIKNCEKYDKILFRSTVEEKEKSRLVSKAIKKITKSENMGAIIIITDEMRDIDHVCIKKQKLPVFVVSKNKQLVHRIILKRGCQPIMLTESESKDIAENFEAWLKSFIDKFRNSYFFEEKSTVLVIYKPKENEEIIRRITLQ